MKTPREQLPAVKRIPTWALVVAPILAAVISNADVVLLIASGPHLQESGLTATLATTIPLSIAASGLTLWFLLRLRHEVDRRAVAETEATAAMESLSRALDRERMLRQELDHRVRNNLSALLGLVGMYEGSESALADVVASLSSKIMTLRESYNLIAATHGEGIELSDLLRAIVAALLGAKGKAVTIEGPSVRLTSREANAFAMIAQELLTNASKHGALRDGIQGGGGEGGGGGKIYVGWECQVRGREAHVELCWTEHPVAGVAGPANGGAFGIGLAIVRGFAESDLRGKVSFKRDGDRWIVRLLAILKLPGAVDASVRPHMEVCA